MKGVINEQSWEIRDGTGEYVYGKFKCLGGKFCRRKANGKKAYQKIMPSHAEEGADSREGVCS